MVYTAGRETVDAKDRLTGGAMAPWKNSEKKVTPKEGDIYKGIQEHYANKKRETPENYSVEDYQKPLSEFRNLVIAYINNEPNSNLNDAYKLGNLLMNNGLPTALKHKIGPVVSGLAKIRETQLYVDSSELSDGITEDDVKAQIKTEEIAKISKHKKTLESLI